MHSSRLLLAFIAFVVWQHGSLPLRAQTGQRVAGQSVERSVRFTLSDAAPGAMTEELASVSEATPEAHEYPDYVSKDPGFPRKPIWERPGDFNASQSMDPRYCQDEHFRAGWPLDIRKRAICAVNDHYYGWYVGGGAGLPFPRSRTRSAEEGTWGLDYSLWKKPRTVWMKWTCGRYQGGEGAYATDHEPRFEHLKSLFE